METMNIDMSDDDDANTTLRDQIQSLTSVIANTSCLCQGTLELPKEDFILFYGKGPNAKRVDLLAATKEQLDDLLSECDPATFGLNQADVLDESYRKAGKLDKEHFSFHFDPERAGLIDLAHSTLLEGHDGKRKIEVELYKLNVYGQGSFFKAHKDTPRSDRMFASLVIVFPTAHEGGALLLRHQEKEWAFDSGKIFAAQEERSPSIAYVAFFSDVEHEVEPVISGHRITVTYNISFAPDAAPVPTVFPPTMTPNGTAFASRLSELLADPTFLPKGGMLGFGLRHQYPVSYDQKSKKSKRSKKNITKTVLPELANCLKGGDAIVKHVCDSLSLQTHMRIVYETKAALVMCDGVYNLSEYEFGENTCDTWVGLQNWMGGKIIKAIPRRIVLHFANEKYYDYPLVEVDEDVIWITELTPFTTSETSYIAYGNEPTVAHMYGNICLVVAVGEAGNRATVAIESGEAEGLAT